MYLNEFSCFLGKCIEIEEVNMVIEEKMCLVIKCLIASQQYKLVFDNVSNLFINEFSPPVIVLGFEIIDNAYRGWEKHVRYTIRDYEEGLISFYCQDIKVIVLDTPK